MEQDTDREEKRDNLWHADRLAHDSPHLQSLAATSCSTGVKQKVVAAGADWIR
jgi:hypothetical protein